MSKSEEVLSRPSSLLLAKVFHQRRFSSSGDDCSCRPRTLAMVSWAVRKASSRNSPRCVPSAGRGQGRHSERASRGHDACYRWSACSSGLLQRLVPLLSAPNRCPCGAQTVGLGNMVVGQSVGTTFPSSVLWRPPHGRPAEGQPVQSFVVSATGMLRRGTPRSVERRFIFHPMSGWKEDVPRAVRR